MRALSSARKASGSTAEPITHFQGNPHLEMIGAEALTAHAAQVAVRVTIFHWGLHGWGLYVLTGLGIAYFSYRRGQPLALRAALYPLLGERVNAWPGEMVDLIGVVGTVFGVATSIGLAVAGMNAAMSELFGIGINTTNQLVIVALVVGLGITSVISGVARGIRRLSEINVWLSTLLLLAILIVGPTAFLLGFVVTSFGDYAANVIPMGFWTANSVADQNWQGAWTVFYWGWWLAWTPFVGLFIARISRGRTVREFVLGVMLVPRRAPVGRLSVSTRARDHISFIHLVGDFDRFRNSCHLHIAETRRSGDLGCQENDVGRAARGCHGLTDVCRWGDCSAGGIHRYGFAHRIPGTCDRDRRTQGCAQINISGGTERRCIKDSRSF